MKKRTLKAIFEESITQTYKQNIKPLSNELRIYNLQDKDLFRTTKPKAL